MCDEYHQHVYYSLRSDQASPLLLTSSFGLSGMKENYLVKVVIWCSSLLSSLQFLLHYSTIHLRQSCHISRLLGQLLTVWNPHLCRDVVKIEKIHKFALRLCYKQWDMYYVPLLRICLKRSCSLSPLEILSALCIYKIVNNLMEFPPDIFIPRATSGHFASTSLYQQPLSHTNSNLFSVVPNACSLWNKLPSFLRSSDFLLSFKTSLREWLHM